MNRFEKNKTMLYKEALPYGEYPKSWTKEMKQAQATRHYNILHDCMELLQETLSEDTFRNRYEAAVREAQVVVHMCGRKGIGIRAGRMLRYLINEKEQLVEDFIDRCKAALEECVLAGEYVA